MKNPMKNPTQLKLIAAGVRNLREFGYPDCDAENILTDSIYSRFFLSMLEENLENHSVLAPAIKPLIDQIKAQP